MKIFPHLEVNSIKIGMSLSEVDAISEKPIDSISTNSRGEFEEHRGEITVRYSTNESIVVEISFRPDNIWVIDGQYISTSESFIEYLLTKDPNPVECLGFLLFLNIGVASSGYHDNDDDQKSISVFERGRWDSMRRYFRLYKNTSLLEAR